MEPEAGDVAFVASATPITFIGDSHTLAYADLIFRGPGDQTYLTRSNYCRGITAGAFLDAEGSLNADVAGALLAAGMLEGTPSGLIARHRATDLHSVQVGIAMQRPRSAPALVFSVGDIDCKFGFIREFADADFALPPAYGFEATALPAHASGGNVPFALALGFVKKLVAPYFRGLVALARLGFTNVFLHALPPQTADDAAFARINGFSAPARLRYKATVLFNAVLHEFVRDYPEFRLVDTWDRVTTSGIVDPGFHLDDSHLNRRGAALVVADVVHELARRARRASGAANAPALTDVPLPDVRDRFARDGILAVDVGAAPAEALRAELHFAPDPEGAQVRANWAGDPLAASRFVEAAKPDGQQLERWSALFSAPQVHDAIASCAGGAWEVTNVRALRTLAPEDPQLGPPPLFCAGDVPPGVLRGILYLGGVAPDAQPLTFTARGGASAQLRPPAGTLVLYDPLRLDHRDAAGTETLDLFVAPAPAGRPWQLTAAGTNHYWPLE